ncbi:TPA: type I restriction-modification system subunit M [Neisseria lactamica]|nr:type I restriction-modification system subunit M [Neisseria lactamica]
MAIKKNQLYASLWAGCDELRGGMDATAPNRANCTKR